MAKKKRTRQQPPSKQRSAKVPQRQVNEGLALWENVHYGLIPPEVETITNPWMMLQDYSSDQEMLYFARLAYDLCRTYQEKLDADIALPGTWAPLASPLTYRVDAADYQAWEGMRLAANAIELLLYLDEHPVPADNQTQQRLWSSFYNAAMQAYAHLVLYPDQDTFPAQQRLECICAWITQPVSARDWINDLPQYWTAIHDWADGNNIQLLPDNNDLVIYDFGPLWSQTIDMWFSAEYRAEENVIFLCDHPDDIQHRPWKDPQGRSWNHNLLHELLHSQQPSLRREEEFEEPALQQWLIEGSVELLTDQILLHVGRTQPLPDGDYSLHTAILYACLEHLAENTDGTVMSLLYELYQSEDPLTWFTQQLPQHQLARWIEHPPNVPTEYVHRDGNAARDWLSQQLTQ